MDKPLRQYHLAWLLDHPERDEAWLRRMTAGGFDIHHLDGNHSNNDPGNLALIEHRDHLMLHAGVRPKKTMRFLVRAGPKKRTMINGCRCYWMRHNGGATWNKISDHFRIGSGVAAMACAKKYALLNDLCWPCRGFILKET